MSKWGAASAKERQSAPDGVFCGPGRSFPVADKEDFDNAVHRLGSTKHDTGAIKACMTEKAKANGWALPLTWQVSHHSWTPVKPSGDNVLPATFAMGDWQDLGVVTFSTGGEHVVRRGKVFAAGDYPDKAFSASPEDLVVAQYDFDPVPNKVQHIDPATTPTYFDGHLGKLTKLEFQEDGETLVGELAIPRWFDNFMREFHPDKPLSVSLEFDRQTKRVVGNTLVPNPRIADSAMLEAFAAANMATHKGVQATHDMAVAHGASCKGGATAGMADTHATVIQRFHDVAKAHGATCVPGADGDGETGMAAAPAVVPKEEQPMSTTGTTAEMAAITARLEAAEQENERLRKARESDLQTQRGKDAVVFANAQVAAKKAYPAERQAIIDLYVQAAKDDHQHGVANFDTDDRTSTRVAALEAMFDNRPAHVLTTELVGDAELVALANQMETERAGQKKKPDQARIEQLMSFTATGQEIIAERNGHKN